MKRKERPVALLLFWEAQTQSAQSALLFGSEDLKLRKPRLLGLLVSLVVRENATLLCSLYENIKKLMLLLACCELT